MEEKNIIELRNIKKVFEDDDTTVVEDFNLEVKKGEFVTFLGPSGCGKTTTLRMIAGFDFPTEGEILLNGEDISHLPPNLRPINTVFQRYALFPHLNVYDNVAFGLNLKKLPKHVIDEKVKKVLEVVDLEGFEKRKISTLSGGQQQRIAIARAIVNEPDILLLDEPLGALDLKMRKEMQLELKSMHERLGITFIYVTHDQEEALTMSDKVVVMSDGMIQQIGTPDEIHVMPAGVLVNVFDGTITKDGRAAFAGGEYECDLTQLCEGSVLSGESSVRTADGTEIDLAGTEVTVEVPVKAVSMSDELREYRAAGNIISFIYKGNHYNYTVRTATEEDFVLDEDDLWNEGDHVSLMIPKEQIILKRK